MNTFAVEMWYDEGRKCSFYSVKVDIESEEYPAETDKFFDRFNIEGGEYQSSAQSLAQLVTNTIGEKYGAKDFLFDRFEDEAQALPPKPKPNISEVAELGLNFPLRLYCLKVNEQIVVLFNGGLKTAVNAQESELSMRFYDAKQFAARIHRALNDGEILVSEDGRRLLSHTGGSEIILH